MTSNSRISGTVRARPAARAAAMVYPRGSADQALIITASVICAMNPSGPASDRRPAVTVTVSVAGRGGYAQTQAAGRGLKPRCSSCRRRSRATPAGRTQGLCSCGPLVSRTRTRPAALAASTQLPPLPQWSADGATHVW